MAGGAHQYCGEKTTIRSSAAHQKAVNRGFSVVFSILPAICGAFSINQVFVLFFVTGQFWRQDKA